MPHLRTQLQMRPSIKLFSLLIQLPQLRKILICLLVVVALVLMILVSTSDSAGHRMCLEVVVDVKGVVHVAYVQTGLA
jgi:hypothetical protein